MFRNIKLYDRLRRQNKSRTENAHAKQSCGLFKDTYTHITVWTVH